MIRWPQCYIRVCKNFLGISSDGDELSEKVICRAFTEGIPNEIAYGLNLHLQSFPGDQGIQYEKEGEEEEPKEDINTKFEILRHELIEAINNRGKKDADTDTFAKEVIVSLSSMVNAQNISFKELVEALDRNKQPTSITVESSPIELTLKLEQDGKTTNKQVTFKKDAAGNLIGAVIQEKGDSDAV